MDPHATRKLFLDESFSRTSLSFLINHEVYTSYSVSFSPKFDFLQRCISLPRRRSSTIVCLHAKRSTRQSQAHTRNGSSGMRHNPQPRSPQHARALIPCTRKPTREPHSQPRLPTPVLPSFAPSHIPTPIESPKPSSSSQLPSHHPQPCTTPPPPPPPPSTTSPSS